MLNHYLYLNETPMDDLRKGFTEVDRNITPEWVIIGLSYKTGLTQRGLTEITDTVRNLNETYYCLKH